MSNISKVLVFGAGGFLGEHIIQHLASSNFDIYAAVRTKRQDSTNPFAPAQVTYYEGDLEDCAYIQQVVAGMDAIIFSAGCIWRPGLTVAECQRRNVQITQNFFTALGDRPDVRIVYTSSMSAISGSETPFIFSEDSDRAHVTENRLSPYDRAKIECEQIALDYAQRGNNLVILNPGNMLGPGAFQDSKITTSALIMWFCQRNFPVYIDGGHSFCDVRDVAKAHVAALTQGRSGDRYIVAGQNMKMADLLRLLVKLTGFHYPRELPASPIYVLAVLIDALSWITFNRLNNPYHRHFVKSFTLNYYGDSQKAIADLGYTLTPVESTLLDTIKYFYDRGLLSTDLNFFQEMTTSNVQALIYLKQLAQSHPFSRFLRSRIPQIYRTCRSNQYLNEALMRLLSNSQFNDKTGRFQWKRSQCQADLTILRQLFDYLYFASDEFLSEVSIPTGFSPGVK
jgi:dihydroflavonol-4-reductase